MNKELAGCILVVLLLLGCGPSGSDTDISLRLTSRERMQIDTLFSRQVDSLRPLLDSQCTADFDRSVRRATDSMVRQRRIEEVRLRERVLREQLNRE